MKLVKLFSFLTLTFLAMALSSCSLFQKRPENFSEQEKALILTGKKDTPLTVILNTTPEGNAILHKKSTPVPVNSPVTGILAQRMLLSLKKEGGVGIAAPQVGINRRLIYVQRFDKPGNPIELYYNPYILSYSKEKRLGWEGCLSIPAGFGKVERAKNITIKYQLRDGSWKTEKVEGFTAVIFQHEIDHLNGILFIERMPPDEKLIPKEEYRKLKKEGKLP